MSFFTVLGLSSDLALGEDSRLLSRGVSGDDVKSLQKKLEQAGFYSGNVDGVFSSEVEKAVTAFQTARKIRVDGVVGPETNLALDKVLSGVSKMKDEHDKIVSSVEQKPSLIKISDIPKNSNDSIMKIVLGVVAGSLFVTGGYGLYKSFRKGRR